MHGLSKIRWILWEEFQYTNPHALSMQYVHNKYARFKKDPLKTVGGVDYTNYIPYNAKICLKWLSSKGRNSVKINSSSNKNPHAHLQYVHNMYAKLKKIHWLHKLYTVKCDERTDGRTDGRPDGQTGANLNAPSLSSRGHKKQLKLSY